MLDRRLFIASLAAVVALPKGAFANPTGTFSGRSNHVTTGSVTIVTEGGETFVDLGADFTLDRAPDPIVGLGNGTYDPATFMGELASKRGAQRYKVPAGVDASKYSEVYIWCRAADVPLGIASLK